MSRPSPVTFNNFRGLDLSPPYKVSQDKRIYKIMVATHVVRLKLFRLKAEGGHPCFASGYAGQGKARLPYFGGM